MPSTRRTESISDFSLTLKKRTTLTAICYTVGRGGDAVTLPGSPFLTPCTTTLSGAPPQSTALDQRQLLYPGGCNLHAHPRAARGPLPHPPPPPTEGHGGQCQPPSLNLESTLGYNLGSSTLHGIRVLFLSSLLSFLPLLCSVDS